MSMTGQRHISIAAALSLIGFCATGLLAPSASAADILEAQEVTEVEYGTGWYLRGNIGIAVTGDYFSSETSDPDNGELANDSIGDSTFTWGLGAGYRLSNSTRIDFGYQHLGSGETQTRSSLDTLRSPCTNSFAKFTSLDANGNQITYVLDGQTIENCTDQDSSSYNLQSFMGNFYYDFDTPMWGVRPFLGAGLGLVRHQYTSVVNSTTCTPNDTEQCNPTDGGIADFGEEYVQEGESNNGTAYHFAGQIHAGFSVALGDDLYVDTSYTYTRMAEDALWGGTNGLGDAGAPNDFHQVRVGLRWEIW